MSLRPIDDNNDRVHSQCMFPFRHRGIVQKFGANQRTVIDPATIKNLKTVYLVRHAESNENRRQTSLRNSFDKLRKLTLPTKEDVTASVELLDVNAQLDSDVSEEGQRQIENVAKQLEAANFVELSKIQLVAHSPLKRARKTAEGMLGCVSPRLPCASPISPTRRALHPIIERAIAENVSFAKEFAKENNDYEYSHDGCIAPTVSRVTELACLAERTPMERLNPETFFRRIYEFQKWLAEQPEERIAVVGHSLFFKNMLGLDFKFENCDVWELRFSPDCFYAHLEDFGEHVIPWEEHCLRQEEEEEPISEVFNLEEVENEAILKGGWSRLKNLYHV